MVWGRDLLFGYLDCRPPGKLYPILSLSRVLTLRTKLPLKVLWSIFHIRIIIGYGIWPQFWGSFGPQGTTSTCT